MRVREMFTRKVSVEKLNNYSGLRQFIDVCETVGNVILVWPGANVHRG